MKPIDYMAKKRISKKEKDRIKDSMFIWPHIRMMM